MSNPPTFSPGPLLRLPLKEDLIAAFKGKKLSELRTPAAIVDRSVFIANSERVAKETKARGMGFRVHVKSESWGCGVRCRGVLRFSRFFLPPLRPSTSLCVARYVLPNGVIVWPCAMIELLPFPV